jgi:ERCC4-type nuclease
MKIKHSKYKNTGILFELLVRQITADTLKGVDSPAIDILKSYFVKTSLGREYKLYESVMKSKPLNNTQAGLMISTVLESTTKLNRKSIKKQKYNLIKEIKKHYDLESFFGSKISNYKEIAAVYTLIESFHNDKPNLDQINNSKIIILEHLTKKKIQKDAEQTVLEEFSGYDKDVRTLTYKVLLEKFNSKYDVLTNDQKQVLKEYINSVESTPDLRNFYNTKINELKATLETENKNVKDKATQIKISEVAKFLTELNKTDKVDDSNLVDLLRYYQLVNEIQVANGVQV